MEAEYHLISRWRLQGARDDVAAILREPRDLVRWWPEVYLAIEVEDGERGQIVHVRSRGRLPYTLRWSFRELEQRWPDGATIEALGDLAGIGVWTLAQQGSVVLATYDWRVRAEKPWLRRLSPLLKPLFAWNHRWAMAKGEAGLRRGRRRCLTGASPPDPNQIGSLVCMLQPTGPTSGRAEPSLSCGT